MEFNLPDDLLRVIAYKADLKSLIKLCSVSRKFDFICRDPGFWIDKIHYLQPNKIFGEDLKAKTIFQLYNIYKRMLNSGTLYITGSNRYQQLGMGYTEDEYETIPVRFATTDKVFEVFCGSGYIIYVTDEGFAYGIGHNSSHQISWYKDRENISTPVIIKDSQGNPFNDVKQVSGYQFHSALVTDVGNIYTFGNNSAGQLGLGYKSINDGIPNILADKNGVVFSDVKQVACGRYHTAFVTNDGFIYTFGQNDRGQLGLGDYESRYIPTQIEGLFNVVQVACGALHTACITAEGHVYTFGHAATRTNVPHKIQNISNAVQISCGEDSTVAVTSAGSVYAWGDDAHNVGTLGINSTINPQIIPNLNNIIQVSCGDTHTGFLTSTGYVYMTGDNYKGKAGLGSKNKSYKPTKIDNLTNVIQISAGGYNTLFIRKEN